jgi:hypothetical protein
MPSEWLWIGVCWKDDNSYYYLLSINRSEPQLIWNGYMTLPYREEDYKLVLMLNWDIKKRD